MRSALLIVLVISLALPGCSSAQRVAPGELLRLDGFQAGQIVRLRTISGRSSTYRQENRLVLILRNGTRLAERFGRIDVDDGIFYGFVAGTGAQVAVPMEEIVGVEVWPYGEEDVGDVSIMIGIMWVLFGLAAWAFYAIVRELDDGDVSLRVRFY